MKSKFASIGLTAGSIGLLLALFTFWAGPFAPKQTVESVVAEKAAAIRDATVRALKGEDVEKTFIRRDWDIDNTLDIVTALLGGLALILGVVAYARSESKRMAGGAVALGASAIAFQFVAMYAMALLVVLLIASVLHSIGFDF